jgi:glycosyltransferase involved in cell wall biosynthesis
MLFSMAARPHILFLSQCLPYPPQSGVRSRTFNVLRELQRAFDVTLLPFSRRNHQPTLAAREAARSALEQVSSGVARPVPVPAEESDLRWIWDHLRSLVTKRPYTYYQYHSARFRDQLRDTLRGAPPDLIHLDSPDLHRWLPELPEAPTTCTHHDIDPLLLRRRADHARNPLLSRYLRHQATLVEHLQRVLCPRFRANIVMSELDAERLRQLAPGSHTVVLPNGVDTDYFSPTPDVALVVGRIVFVGPTYQVANRDAAEYLVSDIFPRVSARCSTASLHLIGDCPQADQRRYNAQPGVSCWGHVPDVRPHVAEAMCSIVPIRVGGGTRVKILDSWAMGKAVVSTSAGCEGLDTVDGENILVRDTPAALADAVLEVLRNRSLQCRLGAAGRQTVEKMYGWHSVGRDLRRAYWRIMKGAALPTSPQQAGT